MKEIKIPGKCILAGEHSVLVGMPALAMPINKFLTIVFEKKTSDAIVIKSEGIDNQIITTLLNKAIKHCCEKFNINPSCIHFSISANNEIPVGFGLGSSAAVCVAIGYWLCKNKIIKNKQILTVAQTLENIFHGKSSGLDVACVYKKQLILFEKGKIYTCQQACFPTFSLVSTHSSGDKKCNKTSELISRKPPNGSKRH